MQDAWEHILGASSDRHNMHPATENIKNFGYDR